MRIRATNSASIVTYLIVALVGCLTASDAGAQRKPLIDNIRIDTIASTAMRQYLNTPYRGNGKLLPGAQVGAWLARNRVSISKLPADLRADISKGNVNALLIPDVANPMAPGTRGEVILVRSNCLLRRR